MSERLQDADRAVDEQKRRARRRLVGAVVLAASAAVIVPMLLEKEPQPLGEDVSVQIPPVDEGKFVNRLTRGKGDAPTKADAKAAPPPKSDAPRSEAPKADTAKADAANTEPAKAPAPEPAATNSATDASSPATVAPPPAAPAKSIGQAEQRMLTPTPPKSGPPADAKANVPAKSASSSAAAEPAPAAAAPAAAAAAPSATPPAPDAKAAPSGNFAVQLAAFSDDKGANALANKLKKAGYASAHVETVDAKGSKLWRVRVGGFATRAEAEAARVKLKNEGFNGMVAPAR